MAKGTDKTPLPRALPGFESIRRYFNATGMATARILPGEFYVTCEDEVIDTVLGSCVAACIRNPRLGIGGMNHFMLPRPTGFGNDTWESVAGRATRYGGAPGVTYLIRPDQHVAARFARYDPDAVRRALVRAIHREAA